MHQLDQELAEQVAKVMPLIEKNVYGFDNDELETVVGKLLIEKKLTLGVAESCTGGYVSAQITKVPGSSAYFWGSVVSYSNSVKVTQLGVRPETLEQFGAVSEETIRQMAEGVRKALGTHIGIATSGIAGPVAAHPISPLARSGLPVLPTSAPLPDYSNWASTATRTFSLPQRMY